MIYKYTVSHFNHLQNPLKNKIVVLFFMVILGSLFTRFYSVETTLLLKPPLIFLQI